MAKVFFTKEITPDSLKRIYDALGVRLEGKVGVKVSTGEKGAKGYLKADLIGPLVKDLHGTIVECNTAYPGARNTATDHMKVAEEHCFAYCEPGGEPVIFNGECTGTIAKESRGKDGRWHDFFFIPDGETKTLAEIGDEDKIKKSTFFGSAIDDLAEWLKKKD